MASTRTIPWREDFREAFFDMAPTDWTPPSEIRSSVNSVRDRLTLVGSFLRPDGVVVKLTTRCKREGKDWYAVERSLSLRLGGGR
jgi:hypothetical protein